MATLLAWLSTGKGTWAEVSRILQAQQWTNAYLLTNQFGIENFTKKGENVHLVSVNGETTDCATLVQEIKSKLKGKINDFEIALNFASGTGKEHMALVEAVLEMGFNFRIVTILNNQMEVLGIRRE
ncbi:hypothetical protein HY496_03720 [Candidatus Woesearchaeota archaeon]|nr:hypothetical protein [Candidatus Woesearchaeota archaeon]